MNFSAIFHNSAWRAAERATQKDAWVLLATCEAIVFSWMTVEALLNELAYIELRQIGRLSENVYLVLERGAGGFERVQAILEYLYGRGLADGANPANDMKHLLRLRDGLVHYRFERPPSETLDQLAQRGLVSTAWRDHRHMGWPAVLTPNVALWACETATDAGQAIASLLPDDQPHKSDVDLMRHNFVRQYWPGFKAS